jgi:hypothetical protein
MSRGLSLATRVRIPQNVMSQDLQGETVILNLDTGVYWGLNEVGTRIWNLLREHETLDTILERMLMEYEVTEGHLRQDLLDILSRLIEKGLLEVVGEGVE